ncbi:MAG: PIN domain-containing protein [Gemmatimonadales bacterium]
MIFVDTSAVLALFNSEDPDHAEASDMLRRHLESSSFVTHNYVLLETTALLQRRFGLRAVRLFVERLLPSLDVRWVDRARHERAVNAVLVGRRPRVPLVDQVSFGLMRELGIDQAFAFDDDYRREGFTLLT